MSSGWAALMPSMKRRKVEGENSDIGRCPSSVLAWNVNSLPRRIDENSAEISRFLAKHQPDVLALSETWLKCEGEQHRIKGGKGRDGKELAQFEAAFRENGVFADYSKKYISCHHKMRRSGVLLLVRRGVTKPSTVTYNLPTLNHEITTEHHPEGRVILATWDKFELLLTYTPNHGSKETWERRATWDRDIISWLEQRAAKSDAKPLLYVGDLNCAADDTDLSHPKWFKDQMMKDPKSGVRFPVEQSGQPGCTPIERARFSEMLAKGRLIDVFRLRNPATPNPGPPGSQAELAWIRGPRFTWRGSRAKEGNPPARYEGKGMRIDHCLATADLVDRIPDVTCCGTGEACNDPSFLGSDHSPLLIKLHK